jgi:hypothetical protein
MNTIKIANQEEPWTRNQKKMNTIKIVNQEEPLGTNNREVEEDEHNQGHELVKTGQN